MTDEPTLDKIQTAVKFIATTLDIPEDQLGPELVHGRHARVGFQ